MAHLDTYTPAPLTPPAGRYPVLLVDDQKFVGMAVARLLASEPDIELHCCHAAEEAVAHAVRLAPALILQDLVMPAIDGLTLVGLYRDHAVTANTPVVILSGNDDDGARAQASASGADDYLVKLPAKAELVACIRKHIGARSADAVPAAAAQALEPSAEPTLDTNVVEGFAADGSPQFMRALLQQFFKELNAQAARLQTTDCAVQKAAAHSLKGISNTMGARRLASLCGDFEAALLRGECVDTLSAAIASECTRVEDACTSLARRLDRPAESPISRA